MKIAIIYTARSGSTSIFKYFQKAKPNYVCYNEPWFWWSKKTRYNDETNYEEILKNKNLFIKSTISTLPVKLEKVINDFDKVVFLIRKNFKEQLESVILVNKERTYLNHKKRDYKIYSITKEEQIYFSKSLKKNTKKLLETSKSHNIPLFYYEDLYYKSFDNLFKEIGVEHDEKLFQEFLNINNRYKTGEIRVAPEDKFQKTIL